MKPQSDSQTDDQTKSTGRGAKASSVPPTQRRLLIVDSDAEVASFIQARQQSDLVVTVTATSAAALDACQHEQFDLAAIDQQTLGTATFDLARQIRDQFEVRCILLAPPDAFAPIESMDDVGALGCFVKPTDPTQLLLAIHVGLLRANEIRALRAREGQLTAALTAERDINTAIGFLMERLQLPRPEAFEMLRQYARSQRQPVAQIAGKMLLSINETNDLLTAIVEADVRHKSKEHKHRPRREPN